MGTAAKYDLSKLVTYDVRVPSRFSIIISCVMGWLTISGATIYLGYLVWQWFAGFYTANAYNDSSTTSKLPWWVAPVVGIVVLAAGICFTVAMHGKYKWFFVVVRQGYVDSLDTSGGTSYVVDGIGIPDPLSWDVLLYGYTYANELGYYWSTMTAGDWRDTKKGQLIDFN